MIIYLICFFFTIIFTYIAEKSFNNGEKKKGILFSILAILMPSILAGLRSSSVGIDVAGYVNKSFYKALGTEQLSRFLEFSDIEKGYSFLVYVISRMTEDVHVFYFTYELIIFSLFYYTLYKERNTTKMWLGVLVFLFIFYNATLSMARQSLAIAFIFCSVFTMKNKKYVHTVILFIIALLFHNSAILSIPIYMVIILDKSRIKSSIKFFIYFLTFLILFFIISQYESIINYLALDLKILSPKYVKYLSDQHFVNEEIDINYFDLIFRLVWIFMYVLYVRICTLRNKREYTIYIIFLFIEFAILLVSSKITNVFRVGQYYGITSMIILIPNFTRIFKNDKTNQGLAYLLIIFILFAYWYYSNILYRGYGTYPYESDVIEFLNF